MRALFILACLFIRTETMAAERPLFGFHIPLKPTLQHCELAKMILEESPEVTRGYDAHLNNAANCEFYEGNVNKAIELWSEAYTFGIDRSLEPLARVLSLSELKRDRLLGTVLLRAYISQEPTDSYLLPLFLALQNINFSDPVDKNKIFDFLHLSYELESEHRTFVTAQIVNYLNKIDYFEDETFEQQGKLSKLTISIAQDSISYCYISDALKYDIFKLPRDSVVKEYFDTRCMTQ